MTFKKTMGLWQKVLAIGVGLVGTIFFVGAVSSGNWPVATFGLALSALYVATSLTFKTGNTP